jgi:CRP-like cAMP-binding protein
MPWMLHVGRPDQKLVHWQREATNSEPAARVAVGGAVMALSNPTPHRDGEQGRQLRDTLRNLLTRTLPNCSAETRERLIREARIRTVQPGEKIYRQDEPAPLTLILTGHGAARRTTVSGKELVSGVAPPGVLFGWSGLASVPSSVEMVALTECHVGQWQGTDVRAMALADPTLGLAAIDSMAWSLHQTVERIEGFLHQDARLRVVRILATHRDLFFEENAVLTRTHLPGLVGTSREMTGKVLRQLEHEGTIARVGRTGLKLLRPDQLEGVAP